MIESDDSDWMIHWSHLERYKNTFQYVHS
jgi:hypothetical protein